MTRFLLHAFPVPTRVAPLAQLCEEDGWDGLLLADSQRLLGIPNVRIAVERADARIEEWCSSGIGAGGARSLARALTAHVEQSRSRTLDT